MIRATLLSVLSLKPACRNFYTSKPNTIRPLGFRVRADFEEVCGSTKLIVERKIFKTPPWKLEKPQIDLGMREFSKELSPHILNSEFAQIKSKYCFHYSIYTDGSKCLDRTGCAIYAPINNIRRRHRLPENASVYTAELQAIKLAVELAGTRPESKFIIFTDSLSSISALQGRNYEHPFLIDILENYTQLNHTGKSLVIVWVPSHCGIPGNEIVDTMAKEALYLDVSLARIPFTDFKPKVTTHVQNKWQAVWDSYPENKLYQIYPTIKIGRVSPSLEITRHEERVLARIKIGHTYFTHSYLLKGEEQPFFIPCHCPITVKHILISCYDFGHLRPQFYTAQDLKTLFENTPVTSILDFIKAIGLLTNLKFLNLLYKIGFPDKTQHTKELQLCQI